MFGKLKSVVLSKELLCLQPQVRSRSLTCIVITMKITGDALVPDVLK